MGFFWSYPPPPPPPSLLDQLMTWTSSLDIDMKPDPRASSKLMMSSISYPISIVLVYAFISLYLGPKIVIGKENSQLRQGLTPFLHVFNIVRVSMNGVLGVLLCYHAYYNSGYSLLCQPASCPVSKSTLVDYSSNRIFHLIWTFYIFKLVEICDIVFLLGLNKNLSGFQLYHHTTALIFAWLGVNYAGGGSSVFPIICNCFTGVIIYIFHQVYKQWQASNRSRYFQVFMGFHLLQFGLILGHSCLNLWMNCGYPPVASSLLIAYMLTFYAAVFIKWSLQPRHQVKT